MSLGHALSREAHEVLDRHEPDWRQIQFGEGGEDPIRYKVLDDVGTDGTSATYHT